MMQNPDSEQMRKLGNYKQEEQNLNRLANSKNPLNQPENPDSRMNMGPFYMRENPNQFQLPPVPETVLRQEMENEQDNSNDEEGED